MNETLIYNKEQYLHTIMYLDEPVINLIWIRFITSNIGWTNLISGASLILKIAALDDNKNELYSEQNFIQIGAFDSPSNMKPIFEVNQTYRIKGDSAFYNLQSCKDWKAEISLNNLIFDKDESLLVEFMDSNYIKRRLDDWELRVNNLVSTIKNWIKENKELSTKPSRKVRMFEEMMQTFNVPPREIETLDIIKNNKVIMAFKPSGLWTLGANGRIDFLTAKRNYIVIDEADRFQEPSWKLYISNNKNKGIELTKETFFQLIGL